MFNLRRSQVEILPTENGTVSATKLPADRDTSTIKFETATFGLG